MCYAREGSNPSGVAFVGSRLVEKKKNNNKKLTKRKVLTPEGIEPSTFGFGIRRATNYAMESIRWRYQGLGVVRGAVCACRGAGVSADRVPTAGGSSVVEQWTVKCLAQLSIGRWFKSTSPDFSPFVSAFRGLS